MGRERVDVSEFRELSLNPEPLTLQVYVLLYVSFTMKDRYLSLRDRESERARERERRR